MTSFWFDGVEFNCQNPSAKKGTTLTMSVSSLTTRNLFTVALNTTASVACNDYNSCNFRNLLTCFDLKTLATNNGIGGTVTNTISGAGTFELPYGGTAFTSYLGFPSYLVTVNNCPYPYNYIMVTNSGISPVESCQLMNVPGSETPKGLLKVNALSFFVVNFVSSNEVLTDQYGTAYKYGQAIPVDLVKFLSSGLSFTLSTLKSTFLLTGTGTFFTPSFATSLNPVAPSTLNFLVELLTPLFKNGSSVVHILNVEFASEIYNETGAVLNLSGTIFRDDNGALYPTYALPDKGRINYITSEVNNIIISSSI